MRHLLKAAANCWKINCSPPVKNIQGAPFSCSAPRGGTTYARDEACRAKKERHRVSASKFWCVWCIYVMTEKVHQQCEAPYIIVAARALYS
jgi:hypothetical protein